MRAEPEADDLVVDGTEPEPEVETSPASRPLPAQPSQPSQPLVVERPSAPVVVPMRADTNTDGPKLLR